MELELTNSQPSRLSAEMLIQSAIQHKVDVDTMERLLVMRTQLKAEAARESYFKALSEFQHSCPVIVKDKTVMNKDGKSVRYRYAPIDSIIRQVSELLKSHGFSYRFESATDKNIVTATCIASHIEGHSESTSFQAQTDPDAYMNIQQRFGSALTFAKRYAFCNAFGILTGEEDDDSQSTVPDNSAKAKLERFKAAKAKEGQVVNSGPEETDEPSKPTFTEVPVSDEALDFITQVNEANDADSLTDLAMRYKSLNDDTGRKAARRAIDTRAKALRLSWEPTTSCFM